MKSRRPFHVRLLSLALALCAAIAPARAALPDSDPVATRQSLDACAVQVEAELAALGRLKVEELGPLPAIFQTVQTGWLNVAGEYMSEMKAVREFTDTVSAWKKQSPARAGWTLTDVLLALHAGSPDHRQSAGNGFLLLDTMYNLDTWDAPKDMLRALKARRLFSDLNMALAQSHYLGLEHKPMTGGQAPRFVRLLVRAISAIPGQRGKAIRDTLSLLGLEDLTASIFTGEAVKRLADPVVRRRILDLNAALVARLRSARPGDDGPTAWELARECCGDDAGAMELLGIYTTQHRTLAKTILPRVPTRAEQVPMLIPLLRCASNFFLVQELSEATRKADGTRPFPYPPGVASDNRRFYHFWSESFIAHTLTRRGFAPNVVKFVTSNLGRAYETYTLPLNVRFALKTGAKVLPSLGGWSEDVRSHVRGAAFALSLFQKAPDSPEAEPAVVVPQPDMGPESWGSE